MSCLRLKKKISPANKVWKGFTSTLQSQTHQFRKSKAYKATTRCLENTLLYMNPILPPKLRVLAAIPTPTPILCGCRHCCRNRQAQKSLVTIWIEKFFANLGFTRDIHAHPQREYVEDGQTNQTVRHRSENEAETSMIMQKEQNPRLENGLYGEILILPTKRVAGERVTCATIDASEASSMSLRMHGVDPQFDEFIEKNRERFRIEKEESLERANYYAMLPYLTYFDPDY